MNNNIFWHICELNNWKDIVLDQFETIQNSGLINNIQNIYITFLGQKQENINWLLNKNNKLILYKYSSSLYLYEKICLDSLFDWSLNNTSNVLYIHAKGVTHPNNQNVWNWRKMMEHFLINQYDKCLIKLNNENCDAVGCVLTNHGTDRRIKNETHNYHFSGNFWWSNTKYIKTLPKIPDIKMYVNNNYWLCERWILYHYPNMKIFVPFQGQNNWYYKSSPNYL